MATSMEDVYCTLVMSDSYLPGAMVLAHSLKDNGTKKKLAAMVTLDSVRASTLTELKSLYDYVIPVDRIGTPNPSNLYVMNRADLVYAFTKIALWRLTQFRKIVYIDADAVAIRAPDELFDITSSFAAAPDVGWPDAFNTGVMVLSPHMGDYWALKTLSGTGDSFDGADQGLLNQYFEHKDWHRLSFTYNCTPSANYQYEPAYRYHKSRISVVHFIGKDKPWMSVRSRHAAPGAYNELLSRWWAVYDRHFFASTKEYMNGLYTPATGTAQQVAAAHIPGPEAAITTTEPDLAEPVNPAEEFAKGNIDPTPTAEQRRFSAPHAEWDATRAPPPANAQPEAANFPSSHYTFNEDPALFRAPASYPEPPRDMWFSVPDTKPAPPEAPLPPIFPWEEREKSRPTRVFLEDIKTASPPESPPFALADEFEVQMDDVPPITPTIRVTSEDAWGGFTSRTGNAWDEIQGIDRYVRALNSYQRRRSDQGNRPFPTTHIDPGVATAGLASPGQEDVPRGQRRESIILTDFPSEIERPSLPVTPAPIRRPTFWGAERDQEGLLPSAAGVPDQADWDPTEKLEELRRNSVIMASTDLKLPERKIPDRRMPSTAAPVASPEKEAGPARTEPQIVHSPQPIRGTSGAPQFANVDFAASASEHVETVHSPTNEPLENVTAPSEKV